MAISHFNGNVKNNTVETSPSEIILVVSRGASTNVIDTTPNPSNDQTTLRSSSSTHTFDLIEIWPHIFRHLLYLYVQWDRPVGPYQPLN